MKKKILVSFVFFLLAAISGCGQRAQDSTSQNPGTNGSRTERIQEDSEVSISGTENDETETSGTEVPETEETRDSGNLSEDMSVKDSESAAISGQAGESELPVVYMTTDISSQGLMDIYQALSASPSGKIAIKLSTGEPGSNYLRTDLIGELVQSLGGTIVECNTAYGGSRANTAMHYQVAEDHGYTAIADVDIMDEDGSLSLPVTGGDNLTENYVGAHFADYDYYVILSHFKGHTMAGFGGGVQNNSFGIASSGGVSYSHLTLPTKREGEDSVVAG